jgi:hypothetical protein
VIGRTGLASLLAMTLASCSHGAPPDPNALRAERAAQLEEIAAACGLDAKALRLVGTENLHFKPSPDENYERIDCVLKALSKTDIPLRMGFVGNETYRTGNQQ